MTWIVHAGRLLSETTGNRSGSAGTIDGGRQSRDSVHSGVQRGTLWRSPLVVAQRHRATICIARPRAGVSWFRRARKCPGHFRALPRLRVRAR